MGKYFGTDGVRGVANKDLNVALAYKVGRYLGYYFSKENKGRLLIGKDTRLSSSMLEAAISAGALESGADVYQIGYTSTPSVSYLVNTGNFDCGIMISASHNPYYDNGIKVFRSDGTKISEELEDQIEAYFEDTIELPKAEGERIGCLYQDKDDLDRYIDYLLERNTADLSGLKIAVDLANGSACYTARRLFERLNVKVDYYYDKPDGLNINKDCGSTHLEHIVKIVKEGNYSVGFAFDGDADRVLAVAENGDIIDGDAIMYICGKEMKNKGLLKDDTVVTTVMSNIGLFKALNREDIRLETTKVGDKYVFDCMRTNSYDLGGEQSGHIIFRRHANSGDGLLTCLMLLNIMAGNNKTLKELSSGLTIYPQLLINLHVKDKAIINDSDVEQLIKEVGERLGDEGRVLVRTSGTEPLIRVMVEAQSADLCKTYCEEITALLKTKDC